MKLFHCSACGQRVFFENERCESCGAALGFVPSEQAMAAFEVTAEGWQRQDPKLQPQRPCPNYAIARVCNWMVAADDDTQLCVSCRTTEIIPALSSEENRVSWSLLEQAKRRLFYTLMDLKLLGPSRAGLASGLSFRFLEDISPREHVVTGHDDGVITLNIAEADDVTREKVRTAMHEPYRTLLGHFRHESGHYYWDRLVRDSSWIGEYRRLFGDERDDYGAALKRHYESVQPDWQQRYISAYASAHPWEDWAECWAHYLHMVDGLDTAAAWGLRLDNATTGASTVEAQSVPRAPQAIESSVIQQWLPVSQLINELNRALGMHDGYPFVVTAPVMEKLAFVHRVVTAASKAPVSAR